MADESQQPLFLCCQWMTANFVNKKQRISPFSQSNAVEECKRSYEQTHTHTNRYGYKLINPLNTLKVWNMHRTLKYECVSITNYITVKQWHLCFNRFNFQISATVFHHFLFFPRSYLVPLDPPSPSVPLFSISHYFMANSNANSSSFERLMFD